MVAALETSLVRILSPDRKTPVGAGCVVTDQHVVTCAHVVAEALGFHATEGGKEGVTVPLDFAFSSDHDPVEAEVEIWWPDRDDVNTSREDKVDIALLRLPATLPSDVKPAFLTQQSEAIKDQGFVTQGFPPGHPLGVEADGRTMSRRMDGRVQIESVNVAGYAVQEGFSGAPVWVNELDAVAGIVVQKEMDETVRAAFIIPPQTLRDACPPIVAATDIEQAALGRLHNVPELPGGYVSRPDEQSLKRALLDNRKPVGVSGRARDVGLQGMGGIGKSVLAAAVAWDEEVRRAFPDGIFWLPLGQDPNVLAHQSQLAKAISGQTEAFEDVQQGKARLAELLARKRALIILDDVWTPDDGAAFHTVNKNSRLLVTTRIMSVIEGLEAEHCPLGEMSPDEALELIARFSETDLEELPDEATEIVTAAGRLPLAIAMAGKMVAKYGRDWKGVLDRLRRAEVWWHDAHDRVTRPVHLKHPANDVCLASETPLPKFVTQNHDVGRAWFVLLRPEPASDGRLDPQHREKVRRDNGTGNALRAVFAGQGHAGKVAEHPSGDTGERIGPVLERHQIGKRECKLAEISARFPHLHEFVRVAIW